LESERNAASATISWRFHTEQARLKVHRVYSVLPPKAEPI
jgi:hypothetical protein